MVESFAVLLPKERYQRASELTRELGLDVWDALEVELDLLGSINDDEVRWIQRPKNISRHFWFKSAIGIISRCRAVEIWEKLSDASGDIYPADKSGVPSMEESFTALSNFFGISHVQVSLALDKLADECRDELRLRNSVLDPQGRDYDFEAIVMAIYTFMTAKGFHIAEDNFHHLFNHFPHHFLSDRKGTIPISLSYVFVGICTRLGFCAGTIDFPMKVLSLVREPVSDVPVLVDFFAGDDNPVMAPEGGLPRLREIMGLPPLPTIEYAKTASPGALLLRAVRNIANSFSRFPHEAMMGLPKTDVEYAGYAVQIAAAILQRRPEIACYAVAQLDNLPLDTQAVVLDKVAAMFEDEALNKACAERMKKEQHGAEAIQLRSTLAKPVEFFVGIMFRHRTYSYIGVIIGWQPMCMASEEWIQQMGVDSLSRGRSQPFYHVITAHGSRRYVAEENVKPIVPSAHQVREFVERTPGFGMWFDHVAYRGDNGDQTRGRLVPSLILRREYPDDDEVASKWLSA